MKRIDIPINGIDIPIKGIDAVINTIMTIDDVAGFCFCNLYARLYTLGQFYLLTAMSKGPNLCVKKVNVTDNKGQSAISIAWVFRSFIFNTVTSLVLRTKNERTFATLLAKDNTNIALLKSTIKTP